MHAEKVSETIAHFIGMFDVLVEEMRMRAKYLEGRGLADKKTEDLGEAQSGDRFSSNLDLKNYDPAIEYSISGHVIEQPNVSSDVYYGHYIDHDAAGQLRFPHADPSMAWGHVISFRSGPAQETQNDAGLIIHDGPGSTTSHVLQVNVLQDDDHLNMTETMDVHRDTSYVTAELADLSAKANAFLPIDDFERVDSYADMMALAERIRSYADTLSSDNDEEKGDANADTTEDDDEPAWSGHGGNVDFVLAGETIEGTFVNGRLVEDAPILDDFLPDRGLAAPAEKPDDAQTSASNAGGSASSTQVEAGANIVSTIASVVDTGLLSPVMAVMGNYYQIDVISQVFAYSDQDSLNGGPVQNGACGAEPSTLGLNIATFARSEFPSSSSNNDAATSNAPPLFPDAWRVSVLEGDVSFIHWIEQYNFVSDNDTMTVTTSQTEATVLTGGNAALSFASYFGYGMHYDLIIVGGNVLDMNYISQISILYDNDGVFLNGGAGQTTANTGGNLLWNSAVIENVGSNDRFEAMPDSMGATVDAINAGDSNLPQSLATNANFEGYAGLNVLYITGNLFDVTVIKQVSILGDADQVTHASAEYLADNPDASVTVNTGANAVVNIAQIIDYDSFGQTTYVGGDVYSDAILIQGGLVEHDQDSGQPSCDKLANEAIAFFEDDAGAAHKSDLTFDDGQDLSWSNCHAADVMQSVVA